MKPGKQPGAECVAATDGVDDLDRRSADANAMVAMRAVRTLGTESYDAQSHAFAQNAVHGRLVREPWVEPGQIVVTRLDDRALGDDRVQAVAVVRRRRKPAARVGGEHDHAP